MTLKQVQEIAEALGVSPQALLAEEENRQLEFVFASPLETVQLELFWQDRVLTVRKPPSCEARSGCDPRTDRQVDDVGERSSIGENQARA